MGISDMYFKAKQEVGHFVVVVVRWRPITIAQWD